jgi:hypothetical protein
MVHALEELHRLLRPAGTLIEIHPALEFPFLEVSSNGEVSFSEEDPGFDYEDDSRHAEEAVAVVVGRGVFALDESRRFELRTHASSMEELRDHWAPRRRLRPGPEGDDARPTAGGRCTRGRRRSSSAHQGRSLSTWSRPPSRG